MLSRTHQFRAAKREMEAAFRCNDVSAALKAPRTLKKKAINNAVSDEGSEELIRRSRDGTRKIQFEFEDDIGRLEVQVVPASATRTYVMARAHQEMRLLVQGLETFFEDTQGLVARLREYWQEVQHAQEQESWKKYP
ncbi:hypothetical protein VE03_10193 [Pseudogymnoascus sp. 23342-1-I1]|nr:hypothetical protein VE03_10193 [Pseudogymnoascus sp. 23342-1-I1]